ncbi:MAG TPA: C40 family peptidase [Burkholderiaceae bacterium]|nr:C40 family peptidase [Burkholderiaceae bacterium]
MPPQSPKRCKRSWSNARRHCARYLVPAATVLILSGCASTQDPGSRHASGNALRDSYMSQTRADPLGAYMASRDIIKSYGQNSASPLAETALNMLGVKYRFGGGAPSTGFDCSGLVVYAAEKSLGLKLPRQSSKLAQIGESVNLDELQEGDLVFFNTRGFRNSHVGIYLGDRKFVHAPRSGSVVRIESMDIGYWRKRYNGARRLINDDTGLTIASSSSRLKSVR